MTGKDTAVVTQDELHAYIDGELPPNRRAAVEAVHFCSYLLRDIQQLFAILRCAVSNIEQHSRSERSMMRQ